MGPKKERARGGNGTHLALSVLLVGTLGAALGVAIRPARLAALVFASLAIGRQALVGVVALALEVLLVGVVGTALGPFPGHAGRTKVSGLELGGGIGLGRSVGLGRSGGESEREEQDGDGE